MAFAAVAVVLGGCAEVEGLGRFSAVESEADQPPTLDPPGSGSTSSGSSDDAHAASPPDGGMTPPDADDGASDASVVEDVTKPPPPPPPTNYALGAAADATPATSFGSPLSLNDGNLATAWSPGSVCTGFGGMASYDCSARNVSITIVLPAGQTVGRVVVRPHAGANSTGILTARLTVGGGAGQLAFSEPLSFPATGDATFTFTGVASTLEVSIAILTASTPAPAIGEIEIYGS